ASKRKSGRDATVAEAGHDVGFRLAGQAGVSQPFRQFGEEGFVHIATIQPQRPLMAHCVGSHLAGQTVAFAAKWSEADHGLSRALAAIDFAAARQISMTCRERSVSLREPCFGDRRLAVYSGLRLAALTTLLHFSVCSARCFPNSEGEATNGLDPSSASRAFSFASARPALISLFSLSTISALVLLGAQTPYQALASYPGKNSPTVGISGSAPERAAPVVASARNLPVRTYSIDEGNGLNSICTWPPSRSVSAAAELR